MKRCFRACDRYDAQIRILELVNGAYPVNEAEESMLRKERLRTRMRQGSSWLWCCY